MATSFSPTNTQAGTIHHSTKIVDLTPYGQAGIITGVKVVWSNFIVGLEFVFNGKSAGMVKGTKADGIWEEIFNLAQGDYIVQAFGRAGNHIECLGLRTAKGLTKVWGNPLSGTPFTFGLSGHYIKHMKLGVSEYLDFIEPSFENEMFINCQPVQFSQHGKFTTQLGKRFSDTEEFNDFEWLMNKFNYNVAEVKLWHDGNIVHGIQFSYLLDGTKKTPGQHSSYANNIRCESLVLGEDEHITKILIRAGEIIDHVTLVTDKGRTLSAGGMGGYAYLAVAPQGMQFTSVQGGIGKCLQFVQFHFDEIF